MRWVKGHSGNPAGRPVGSRNKVSGDAVEAIWTTYHSLQKTEKANLLKWAEENPGEFYKYIFTRVIPKEIKLDPGPDLLQSLAELARQASESRKAIALTPPLEMLPGPEIEKVPH